MSYSNGGRVPCKYFQQGRCTRGSSCKFAHVYSNGTNAPSQGGQNMSEANIYRSFVSPNSLNKIERTITNDLKDAESFQQKPLTSAYSYGTPCAVNLISGRDYAPEESRYDYYKAQLQGTVQKYVTQINARENDIKKCFSHVKSHPDWAARFLQKNTKDLAETGQRSMNNEFVNFPLDLGGGGGAYGASSRPSTSGSAPGQSAFGGDSKPNGALGVPAFGSSEFGSAQAGPGSAGGAFGKPAFGSSNAFSSSNSGNAFGASSNPFISNYNNSPGTNIFGQSAFDSAPSPASDGSAFGKPAFAPVVAPSSSGGSAFGKPTFGSSTIPVSGQSAFGKPAFGTTSANAFGSPVFGMTTFASGSTSAGNPPTLTSGSSTFGSDPTKVNGTAGLGKTAFGPITAQPGGSMPAFGQPNFASSPFGKTNDNLSTPQIGNSQNSQNQVAFGDAAPMFGSPASSSSPFASLQGQPKSSSFSQSVFTSRSQPTNSPFGSIAPAGAAKLNTGFGSRQSPFSNVGSSSQPQSTQARFVQGKPTQEDILTASELDQKTREQFLNDRFTLGNVPDIPPPLELIA